MSSSGLAVGNTYTINSDLPPANGMIIEGNVGIGTAAPLTLTEIQGGLTTVGAVLTLSSKETSTVVNDVLGRINFRAALDASGTDAILTGASIAAIAEGNFSASVNETWLQFSTGASEAAVERMRIDHHGNVGIGNTTPSAYLHLAAGSATAFTAPLKFTSGPLNTAAEAGAIEFLTDNLYFTQTTSTIRKKFLFSVGTITTATTTYTALSTDETIICNSTTAFTVSLPVAVVGQKYVIKNINTGAITVDADSTDLIDGVATQTLGQWDCIQLQCYIANNWGIS
jgi:hypothetical protein